MGKISFGGVGPVGGPKGILSKQDIPYSAFGEMLAVPLDPQVHIHFVYGANSGSAIMSGINGGAITSVSGMASADTDTTTSGEAWLLSKQAMRYIPGQGVNARWTARFEHNNSESGYAMAGLLNEDKANGLMFGTSGSTFGILHRKFGVDTFIPQAEWNGDNKFLGQNGGVTVLDPMKGNVFQCQFQWLGFGDIKFGIEEPDTGEFTTVHTIKYANTHEVPSLSNPAMHMTLWAKNNGSATALRVRAASMAAFAEGLRNRVNQSFHTASSGVVTLADATLFNVMSIRNKAQFNGVESENQMFLEHISVVNDGNKGVAIKLIHNAGLTSPTFEDVDNNRSSAAIDTVGTSPTEPSGELGMAFGVEANGSKEVDLSDLNVVITHGEHITIAAERLAAGATPIVTVFTRWREEN